VFIFNALHICVIYNRPIELRHIITEIDASMLRNARVSEFVIEACEVKEFQFAQK